MHLVYNINVVFPGQISLILYKNGTETENAYRQRNRQQKHHNERQRAQDNKGKYGIYFHFYS